MRRTRWIAAALLAAYLPACTSYQTLAGGVNTLESTPKPVKEVKVTLKNGDQLTLSNPAVYGDSLKGLSKAGPPTTVALADIATLETQQYSESRTIAYVLLTAAGIAAVIALFNSAAEWDLGSGSLGGY